jgi:hypothetical protein
LEEDNALKEGMRVYRTNWVNIKANTSGLERRSAVQLKDRARNIRLSLLKSGVPLGVFDY